MNMGGVPYMSSAGLRMLLLVYRQVMGKKGCVVLVGLNDEIRDTMEEIMGRRTDAHSYHLSFQSKVGPAKWLTPDTVDKTKELAAAGVRDLLVIHPVESTWTLMGHDWHGNPAVAAADLELQVRLTVLVPLAENMLSGAAFRPGDVVLSIADQEIMEDWQG